MNYKTIQNAHFVTYNLFVMKIDVPSTPFPLVGYYGPQY